MELDQLRYFLKVAECENFTRAANELGVSQPALSRSIQRLEEELSQPVFERKTRCVALTDAGRLLQKRASQVLRILDDTRSELTDDGKTGRLRVGAIPTIAPYFLPELLRRFANRYPDASVVVYEETTEHLIKRCSQGEVDLAILAMPISAQYLEFDELFREELYLVLPPQHPLLELDKVSLKEVEPYPFVLLDEAHCLTDNIVSYCRQRSFQPVAVENTSQLAMVQELVSLGHGVSMIPAMARRFDHCDRRRYLSLASPCPQRQIAAVWNPYRFHSQLLTHFREELDQYVREEFQKQESES